MIRYWPGKARSINCESKYVETEEFKIEKGNDLIYRPVAQTYVKLNSGEKVFLFSTVRIFDNLILRFF